MMDDTFETLLIMDSLGLPIWSARGINQTLKVIPASSVQKRTINGELIDLSYDQFRKYESTISGRDIRTPSFDGIWPGRLVNVHCISELSYPTGGSATRPEVSGSSREENGFVFFRPILSMMIVQISAAEDEWGADKTWEITLEEV